MSGIVEGLIVEVGRQAHRTRIWFVENPLVCDSYIAKISERAEQWWKENERRPGRSLPGFMQGGHGNPQPREACVFIASAPKTMAPCDRVRVIGSMLLWYPNPNRHMTHGGVPVELPVDWHMPIELIPGTQPIDPRGKTLLKVV